MPTIDRREGDTPRSLAALQDYAAMGAGRSLRDLAARYRRQSVDGSSTARPPTTRFETIGTWSAAHDWQNRVADYDRQLQEAEEAARATIRASRRLELENADWNEGKALREAVGAILLEMPKFIRGNVQRIERDGVVTEIITVKLSAGPGEIARAMKLASELQRLSVGVATEHIEHSGAIQFSYEQAVKDMGEAESDD